MRRGPLASPSHYPVEQNYQPTEADQERTLAGLATVMQHTLHEELFSIDIQGVRVLFTFINGNTRPRLTIRIRVARSHAHHIAAVWCASDQRGALPDVRVWP